MDDKVKNLIQNHIDNKSKVTIDELNASNKNWLNKYMSK